MEVVPMNLPRRESPAGTVGLPFNKRNVEEWSRLDRLTGIMETAKIETDHWAARSNNAAHKYGKMVDSRERNNQDGSLQERQRKQMEVFQTQVPGGSMQVIRTQTYTTSSKSSKWMPTIDKGFEDLKLPINSLDLSSQKTKGSVGRSGSIGGRRPPSRPRSLISQSSSTSIFEDSSIARICQRLHDQAKSEMFKSLSDFNGFHNDSDTDNDHSSVVITEIPSSDSSSFNSNNLSKQKSCSNENLADDDNNLKRSSKMRRSLQIPKQSHSPEPEIDWCAGKSLKERAAEIENLLRRGSSTATTISQASDKSSDSSEKVKTIKTRDSFVSAETLNEVRDRLKKTHIIDNDDGIVTEKEEPQSKVKCFVYGMEAMLAGNRNINGTGSLESRNNKNSANNSRTAEWYKRRKSYGFEQVEEPDKFDKFNRKYNMESSTDSGICRSSETVSTPSWSKFLPAKLENLTSPTIVTVGKVECAPKSVNSVYVNNTPTNAPSIFSIRDKEENRKQMFKRYDDSLQSETVWNRKSPIPIQRKNDVRESLKSSLRSAKNPWISQLRGTKLVDRNWISDEHDSDAEKIPETPEDTNSKKNKKVEFCKTEVHFAAEPGKFKLVETDGKPPPNDIFRRRKRTTSSTPKNTSGLPEIKFGDSVYEKRLLTSDSISDKIEAELKELSKIVVEALPAKEEVVKTPNSPRLYDLPEEADDTPRGILKPLNRPPASPTTPIWRSTVILRNKHFDDVKKKSDDNKLYSSDGESELQIRFRNLRRIDQEKKWWGNNKEEKTEDKGIKRRSLPDDSLLRNDGIHVQKMIINSEEMPTLSVAERIKQVEELRSNNYSSKINFRSGEMTVVQNGTGSPEKVNEEGSKIISTWLQRKSMSEKDFNAMNRPNITCDNLTSSNPPVMRFSTQKDDKTDNQKYQTTRILINFKSDESESNKLKTNNNISNKTSARLVNSYGSWSPGMKKDLSRYFSDLKSTSLVKETIQGNNNNINNKIRTEIVPKEDIPKPSVPVHEIIDQFDSLSLPKRTTKEKQRRKTMPINYKAPKEYTHADLEEELKNFTENLDKDFRDIYEEEIGSLRNSGSLKDIKQIYEPERDASPKKEKIIQPVILNGHSYNNNALKSSSEDGSKKSSQYTSSRNYDSDDSDLLADEEVRSYMSTGQGGSDSESEGPYNSWNSRKSFKESILRFKKLEMNGTKEIKTNYTPSKSIPSFADTFMTSKSTTTNHIEKPKIASIALRYEDDPLFAKTTKSTYTNHVNEHNNLNNDRWEKTSNSSSNFSATKSRERVSYLNGSSLSEKYSKYLPKSSSNYKTPSYSTEVINGRRTKERTTLDSLQFSQPPRSVIEDPKPVEKSSKPAKSFAETFGISDNKSKYREKNSEKLTNYKNLLHDKRNGISERLDKRKKSKEREETDSVILEELTKAADQILIAVNGYTDDDSHLASSEDDDKTRKIIRKDKMSNLSTISEGKRVTKTEARRSSNVSSVRKSTVNHSSASSLESLTKETVRSNRHDTKPVCPRLKNAESTSKPLSSRATRLLQRANSREAVMAQPSSSEDIPNYVELAKKRSVRRQKSSSSVKSDLSAESKNTCSRVKAKTKGSNEPVAVSRVRERRSTTLKDSTNTARTTRTSQTSEIERTKSTSRRSVTDKIDGETTRRKRIQSTHSKDEQASVPSLRKKPTRVNSKKIEGLKPAQTA